MRVVRSLLFSKFRKFHKGRSFIGVILPKIKINENIKKNNIKCDLTGFNKNKLREKTITNPINSKKIEYEGKNYNEMLEKINAEFFYSKR